MAQSTHGLVENIALTVAAQALSKAYIELAAAVENDMNLGDETSLIRKQIAQEEVTLKLEAYDAAYDAYTHRGQVVKTVDVRWPKVGADPNGIAAHLLEQ
jgi:hypothetical protein